MPTIPPEIAERVARGVAVLDEKRPGWEREINLDILDISKCRECILGQLFHQQNPAEPFDRGSMDLLGIDSYLNANDPELIVHGFSAPLSNAIDYYDRIWFDLTAEWKRVIQERREHDVEDGA